MQHPVLIQTRSAPAGETARSQKALSKQQRSAARRIGTLPWSVANALHEQKAPHRIVRWVAWGATEQGQRQRAEVAMSLRRAAPPKARGWPSDARLKAALTELLLASGKAPPMDRPRRVAPASAGTVSKEEVFTALLAGGPGRRRKAPAVTLRTTPPSPAARANASGPPPVEPSVEIARLRRQLMVSEADAEVILGDHEAALSRAREENAHLRKQLAGMSARAPWWAVGAVGAGGVAALLKVATLSGDLARAKREHDAERERARPAEPPVPAGGGEALFMRLLPVLDNIARASRHAQAGAPAATIAEGLVMVLGQLDDALAREGIRRVPAVGLRFDPAQHEAVEHVADVAPAGTVLREELPGYVVGTRLVRAAAVVVSKGGG